MPYNPYFYIGIKRNTERDVLAYLSRKYVGKIFRVEIVEKEDLDLVIIESFVRTSKHTVIYLLICISISQII